MSFKSTFTFRDKRGVPHDVGDKELMFYPNRLGLLTQARDLATPVAKAISVLFADESKDNSSNVKRHHEGEFFMEDVHTEAVDIEMAKYRQQERYRAIEQIMGTLADHRSLMLLGFLFMDSLRDVFPYKKNRSPQDVEEFLFGEEGKDSDYEGLDMPILVQLFGGWMKANAKVFGEVGEKVVGLVRGKLEELSQSTTPEPTSGGPSKMPSLVPSDSASPPSTSTS